ncbi:MAG: acyl-CoA dehydrogenase family protein [Alphaproteobacteria bacterium]|nr:acyl-CoA dehydrogenase family protein [Alphaproteobacteria bacterium]
MTDCSRPRSAADLIPIAQSLRREFEASAAAVDATGEYPTRNMERIAETGLDAICFPRDWGGVATPKPHEMIEAVAEIFTEIAAGESSTAQIFMVHRNLVLGTLSGTGVSDAWKKRIYNEVRHEGARFCSPASEPTKKRFSFKTACTPVEGGVRINGRKYFATGCEGARYGWLPVLLDGYPSTEEGGLYNAVVRLDGEGVTLHHDWDNMGQRATGSGSISFENVFIPDGLHWKPPPGTDFHSNTNISGPASQIVMSSILLGIGLGALDAMCAYVRERVRPSEPGWATQADSPIIQHQVGRYSAMLTSARAALREAARAVAEFARDGGSRAEVSVKMMQAKVAIIDATLTTAGDVNRHCGGMSTSNAFRLDRFWRNARALSTHDSQDIKLQQIGRYVLSGTEPPIDYVT